MNYEEEGQNLPEQEIIPEQPKPKKNLGWLWGGLVGFLCGVLITVGVVAVVSVTSTETSDTTSSSGSKLAYIISLIRDYYYQDVDDETLVDGIYSGVVESLDDPYSAYYNKEEYEDLMVTMTGDYAGIGALLSKSVDTGIVTITKVYADTPAEKAGLQAGDVIVAADEYQAIDEDLDAFVQHVRGEVGTDVVLTIDRDGEEMEFTCTRDTVSTPTIEYQMLDDGIGYIAISQFTSSTYEDFVAAMEDLESQGMTAVIYDLRNNGGGLVDAVVSMLDYILPEGTVVYTMDKYGNREDFDSDAENFVDMPITVLVNGNSASASEIFTGAIRDFDYGTIIGTQTFGKGIVQSTIPLSDGSAVKLTTESYYTPSGECIHGVGITPDIELEYEFLGGEDDTYSIEYDNQIQRAIEVLNSEKR